MAEVGETVPSKIETQLGVEPLKSGESLKARRRAGILFKTLGVPLTMAAIAGLWASCGGSNEASPLEVSRPPTAGPIASQTIEAHPTIEVKVEPRSKFDQVREKVNQASASSQQKEQFLAIVDDFEKTSPVINKLISAYEAQREADGTPTLLALKKRQLGNLLPADSLTKIAQSQLFFLKDAAELQRTLESPAILTALRVLSDVREHDPDSLGIFSIRYSEFGSVRLTRDQLPIEIDPKVESNTRLVKRVAEIRQAFTQILPKVPHRPDLTIYIRESDPEFDAANKRITLGVSGISLNIEGYTDETWEVAYHEFAHSLDIGSDISVSRYFSPEQVVQLLIIREKIVAGSWQPKVEQIFAPKKAEVFAKWQTGQKLTPKDLEILTAIESDRRLFADPKVDFDIFDKAIDAQAILDFSFGGSKIKTYATLSEFLKAEAPQIESLTAQNKLLAQILADIQGRPEVYGNYWESIWPGSWTSGASEKAWWSALRDMARARALELAFEGKLDLSPEKLKQLEDYQQKIAAEIFATSLAQTMIWENRLADPANTPSWRYLQFLAR